MFYRLRRTINYATSYPQIKRLLDTPSLKYQDCPATIVAMVAGCDVQLYILAMKSFYRRLGGGQIVAIIADGVTKAHKQLIVKHLGPVEFVANASIDTGTIQHSGTWERLVYILQRCQNEYVIQMDCDILFVGDIPEVLDAISQNRAFTLADGIPRKPLADYIPEAIAGNSDNIVIEFEKRAKDFPGFENFFYIRGSSGFAKAAANLDSMLDFHARGETLFGPRWREWGTEQIASDFTVANSPNPVPLPKPKYLTWENHELPTDLSLLHFIGYCRFDKGVYARCANRKIDTMLEGRK